MARLDLQPGQVVLDVGCGIGGSAFYMVKVSTVGYQYNLIPVLCLCYSSVHNTESEDFVHIISYHCVSNKISLTLSLVLMIIMLCSTLFQEFGVKVVAIDLSLNMINIGFQRAKEFDVSEDVSTYIMNCFC